MPLTTIECCSQTFTIPEALEHLAHRRNRCAWTYELLAAMVEGHEAHPSQQDPTRISTSTLKAKCLRQEALSRFNDYTQAPEDLWAAFRGTMFHAQLEAWAQPRSYGEARFYVDDIGSQLPAIKKALPRQNRSFSGSPDLVDPVAGVLYDYKRCKEVPRFNSAWGDHVEQLNVNRWLVDNADSVELKDEYPDLHDALDHVAFAESGILRYDLSLPLVREHFVPVEWQELVIVYVDDKGPKPITVTKSIQVPKVGGEGTKAARVPEIWDDERVEAYIVERYIAARHALTEGIAPIPEGWEHQSHVLCGYCPVRGLCAERERQDA